MSTISGISGYYSNYDTTDASASKVENTLNSTDYSKANADELMGACKEFEAYFLEQVMKSMESFSKVPGAEEEKTTSDASSYLENFKDTLYQEMADTATQTTDFGLAQMLYEQMKRNYGITEE